MGQAVVRVTLEELHAALGLAPELAITLVYPSKDYKAAKLTLGGELLPACAPGKTPREISLAAARLALKP